MTTPNRLGKVASNIFTVLIYLYMLPAFMLFVPYTIGNTQKITALLVGFS